MSEANGTASKLEKNCWIGWNVAFCFQTDRLGEQVREIEDKIVEGRETVREEMFVA